MNRLVLLTLLASLGAAAGGIGAGCGSSSAGSSPQPQPDAGVAETSVASDGGVPDVVVEAAPYPATLPTDIPQVANTRGGSVLASPKIIPVYFASDDPAITAKLTDFVSKIGATQYWKAATSEYGVGPAVMGTPIQLTAADNPSATYTDVQIDNWLAAKLNAKDPAFPAPDANTLYALFYPPGVSIVQLPNGGGGPPPDAGADAATGATDAGTGATDAGSKLPTSCVDFGGYHSATTLADMTTNVAYAVIPRCASFDVFTGLDAITGAASHELAEGVTDPYLDAFTSVDSAHRYWSSVLGGGEIGDMCAQNLGSFTKFAELPDYLVQRCWSNKAALTGGDPCVPVPQGENYFNSFPVLPDLLQVNGRGADGGTTTIPTKGVKIAVGSSATIEVDLFSTAPTTQDWTLAVYDGSALLGGSPLLQLSLDQPRGHNGDKLHLTIKVLAASKRNTEPFLIVSTLGASQTAPQNMWAGVVGN